MVISHDQRFLERVCTRVVDLPSELQRSDRPAVSAALRDRPDVRVGAAGPGMMYLRLREEWLAALAFAPGRAAGSLASSILGLRRAGALSLDLQRQRQPERLDRACRQ
jgi:hypothetical protein